jgi:3-deoxy-D-manno-oct-2-ulosonic acid (Kdo) hydroxylase
LNFFVIDLGGLFFCLALIFTFSQESVLNLYIMKPMEVIDLVYGKSSVSQDVSDRATAAMETGQVLFLPHYSFTVSDSDKPIFSPTILSKDAKNVSYNPATKALGGIRIPEANRLLLEQMMHRFADFAQELVIKLLPAYRDGLTRARASFRPIEIDGRVISWRKDDTRLHVDAFPSSPTEGKRILRIFCNVNPEGRGRVWRIGEPFEQTARRFLPSIKSPLPFSLAALQLLRITRGRRTAYDYYMLRLHDRMKADDRYQAKVEKFEFEFPAGSTWLAFSDQVVHAAVRGQYQLEQTFLVNLDRLRDEAQSPLRVLERLVGRKLGPVQPRTIS